MLVFDDVFVPWERVFMCGEVEFAADLLNKFASMHNVLCRGACKVGFMDLMIGGAETIAEYNGITKAAHVRDKMTEMVRIRETTEACARAAVWDGKEEPSGSGVYFPQYNVQPRRFAQYSLRIPPGKGNCRTLRRAST